MMNQRDQELLDKQLWGVSPNPPLKGGIISLTNLTFVVVFFTGIAIGAILFAQEKKQMQFASHDTTAATLLLNGVPPSAR